MKVRFKTFIDKEDFRFVPIILSYSKRDSANTGRRAFYISGEFGYWAYVLQFKWRAKN